MSPQRIQLSRKKGWRMPPNTVKVDRTTRFGNPFIAGTDGTAGECIYWLVLLHAGYLNISASRACIDRQRAYQQALKAEKDGGYITLRGKNLACWCTIGKPCHADIQVEIANRPIGWTGTFNLDERMARYGLKVEAGFVKPL